MKWTVIKMKKVKLKLVGLNGNAWALMGAFQNAALKQGWTKEEVNTVCNECMTGDYYHLLRVLMDNTK